MPIASAVWPEKDQVPHLYSTYAWSAMTPSLIWEIANRPPQDRSAHGRCASARLRPGTDQERCGEPEAQQMPGLAIKDPVRYPVTYVRPLTVD